jgi:hypothetical protein
MEIQAFLELYAGTWFSQRTRYLVSDQTAENHKSEIAIAFLPPSDPALTTLYPEHPLQPEQTLGGWQVQWESIGDWGSPKEKGAATLIFLPDSDRPSEGTVLRGDGQVGTAILQGRYKLGEDEALTLTLKEGNLEAEERIWFASPNLRLRTSLLKQSEGDYQQTAFYSEIRKLNLPPKEA